MLHQSFEGERSLLAFHVQDPQNYPFLLESVTSSELDHYSILFAYPQQHIQLNDWSEGQFLNDFDQAWKQEQQIVDAKVAHLPFRGGWFLYLGYELAQEIEPTLQLHHDCQQLPIACATRIPVAIIVDHQLKQTHVVAEPEYQQAFEQACAIAVTNPATPILEQPLAKVELQEDEPQRFEAGVERIRDYIKAGDVFQVNLSRAWQGEVEKAISPEILYQSLRQANPAPFACLVQYDDFAIISSSPERLTRVKDKVAETRPIAGTRPRSDDLDEDIRLINELIAHPKERAEHIMLIDLERNDLGRICEYGSVEVNELMVIESYQHVHHIVSNVRGSLQDGKTPADVIRATFPGGTITGCPKVRCMEIIAELEQTGRGAYTGSVGYVNHNGDMDLNILIRTITQRDQHIVLRTGAGIVMDSVPKNELKETRHKARGLLRALGHADA